MDDVGQRSCSQCGSLVISHVSAVDRREDQIARRRRLAADRVFVGLPQDVDQRGVVRAHLVVEREEAVRERADDERLARAEVELGLALALEVGAVLAALIGDLQPERPAVQPAMPDDTNGLSIAISQSTADPT